MLCGHHMLAQYNHTQSNLTRQARIASSHSSTGHTKPYASADCNAPTHTHTENTEHSCNMQGTLCITRCNFSLSASCQLSESSTLFPRSPKLETWQTYIYIYIHWTHLGGYPKSNRSQRHIAETNSQQSHDRSINTYIYIYVIYVYIIYVYMCI